MPSQTLTACTSKIPVSEMLFLAATNWLPTSNSGNMVQSKSAAAETVTITIPFAPEIESAQFGIYLNSIVVPITIGVANLTSYTWTLYKTDSSTLTSTGSVALPTPTTIAQTDNGAVTFHANPTAFTITVTTPAFDNLVGAVNPHHYELVGSLVCPSTTTLAVYPATWNYTKVKG